WPMERVPEKLATRRGARRGARPVRPSLVGGCVLLLALAPGCVNMKSLVTPEEMPAEPVAQVAARWEKQVLYAPDPVHGGASTPGLACRLYLFGMLPGNPLVGDGSVVVDLFDDPPVASGGQSRLLEKWCIDKDTLKRLLRGDVVGDGYTLFLP